MTCSTAPIRLLRGQTIHQRSKPFRHRFRYGLNLIDIDLGNLDAADRKAALFSVDRANLFSFRRKDHGPKDGSCLKSWAQKVFTAGGLRCSLKRLRLVTFPRHAFYKFAPISLWLAYDEVGALQGVIYEVNNTFGETHTYVAGTQEADRYHRHDARKAFHVSPFFDVTGRYKFTLRQTSTTLRLIVATYVDGRQTHVATIQVAERRATSLALLGIALFRPFSSLSVTMAIHWQALKLWTKGAKYHSKPDTPDTSITVASRQHSGIIRETAA
ncbi:MAG: DUF1365 domain-containing protein [Henriciella sp.]